MLKTKLRCLLFLLVFTFLESGCGGGNYNSASDSAGLNGAISASKNDFNYNTSDSVSGGFESSDYDSEESDNEDNISSDNHSNDIKADSGALEEMLVYTCSLELDTLQFEDSVSRFKELLTQVGGFVESEYYSNGRSYNRWYYEDSGSDYMQSMNATVRVPSSKYNSFVEGVAGLGDLRDRKAYVENVKQEYTDAGVTLQIYEAKQERYLKLLEDTLDDEYALQIERELTDIQIKIAQLKTRMTQIETDVAYSYVTVSINEVRRYIEKPVQQDTFLQRLNLTITKSWSTFLEFAENVLFLLIMLFPYLIIIGIIVLLLLRLDKVIKKRRKKKKEKIQEKVQLDVKKSTKESDIDVK